MFIFIGLESFNIVYMERKFKTNLQMSFTEQQMWVTFCCYLLTLLFWVFTWETYSALVEKYKLSVNQKILLNLSMLSIVIILITNSSNFF